ncbi:hypothetical protein HPB48_001595 [Haemaphysalis longicornis]|uniref:Uncharacterized protein n=1 Tax=Haemaphysalis longicornis TaxID=44386 RepID=A0A9J6GD80_HAELO|nr:hypothetical protein HPB48_001595 [Haemaphysalis longicornis]
MANITCWPAAIVSVDRAGHSCPVIRGDKYHVMVKKLIIQDSASFTYLCGGKNILAQRRRKSEVSVLCNPVYRDLTFNDIENISAALPVGV